MRKLVTRKGTHKGSSLQKYARDCYLLKLFIDGDPSSTDEVFRKDDQKSGNEQAVSQNFQLVELRFTLQTVMSKVCELEKVNSENQKIIDKLTTDNTNLKDELDKTELLNNHMITFDRKSI